MKDKVFCNKCKYSITKRDSEVLWLVKELYCTHPNNLKIEYVYGTTEYRLCGGVTTNKNGYCEYYE